MQPTVFHSGERAVQQRVGVSETMQWAQAAIRPFMPPQHRHFYAALPFMVAAARDERGRPWATVLTGPDGFVTTPDDRTLHINAKPVPGDALTDLFERPGDDIGLLGIEFSTRRRNRVNGRIGGSAASGVVHVDQTFGNCPQYIREREWRRVAPEPGKTRRSATLTPKQQTWIRNADTLFFATGYRGEGDNPAFGMDASHRGGERGFVQVIDAQTIEVPDYAGNNFFNTIGNLLADPGIGVLFIDFVQGSMLQISGRADIEWETSTGSNRTVRIHIDEVVELPGALSLRWSTDADTERQLRLVRRIRESEDVTSFYFAARDGNRLPKRVAGQHLPIELRIDGDNHAQLRTYTLSNAPTDSLYRISVKREPNGRVSRYLHDELEEGAVIFAKPPAGDFVLPPGDDRVVLISAGIGITPFLSMLHELADHETRPISLLHAARDAAHNPFSQEIEQLMARRPGIERHVSFSQPQSHDTGHDGVGRIDDKLLERFVHGDRTHYFVCGPASFMTQIGEALVQRGVDELRIHTESFGASS